MRTETLELIVNEGKRQEEENPVYFNKFIDYDYDNWRPVPQRREFVKKYATGTSVLDVACGYYPVSEEIVAERKVGIDVSASTKTKAWKELDEFYCLDFTQTSTEFLQENIGAFDTIIASEFLEHLEAPGETIQKMSDLLNEKGRILITVPNGRSIAGFVDKLTNYAKGNGFEYDRFKLFHRTHISCLRIEEWERHFKNSNLEVKVFEYRPSDIVEGFPKETSKTWQAISKLAPNYLAHQYFFVLEKKAKEY